MIETNRDNACFFRATASIHELDSYVLRVRESSKSNTAVRVLRGSRMITKLGLLDEFAAALQFPLYFGRNWDALEECLSDLEWLPADAYVFIISDAVLILKSEEQRDLVTFFDILLAVCRAWMNGSRESERKPISFKVILHSSHSDPERLRERLNPVIGEVAVVSFVDV
jgi:Barstar (barnase inhibitor)